MVHVLTSVLRKVHKALRANGALLIVQPAPENAIIRLSIEGNVEFSEELEEPNFNQYLEATIASIHHIVSERLFVVEDETTASDEGLFYLDEYDSIDEWIEDRRPFCEDLEAFDRMTAKLRDAASGRKHRVIHYWKDYRILLRKLHL